MGPKKSALTLVLSLLMAGCTATPDSPPKESLPPLPGGVHVTSNGGRYDLEYVMRPSRPSAGEAFDCLLRVRDRDIGLQDTTSLADVRLQVDAGMPNHRHGLNVEPLVTEVRPGIFRISDLLLHMPGSWEIYFDITAGAITERAQVHVELD